MWYNIYRDKSDHPTLNIYQILQFQSPLSIFLTAGFGFSLYKKWFFIDLFFCFVKIDFNVAAIVVIDRLI